MRSADTSAGGYASGCVRSISCRPGEPHASPTSTCIKVAEPTWRALDTATGTVRLLGDAIESVRFNEDRMLERAEPGFSTVSELAELLQRRGGQPFRVVHRLIGQIINSVIEEGKTAMDIDVQCIITTAKRLNFTPVEVNDAEVRRALDSREFILAHDYTGGTAPREGRRMLYLSKESLKSMKREQDSCLRGPVDAEAKLDHVLKVMLDRHRRS